VTAENRQNSINEYQKALIYFQKGDLEKASQYANLALQLDPGNADADSLKQRIEQRRNQ